MSMERSYRTTEVFGITRELPLNYTERKSVDDALRENLTRDKHVVIYGSSKQGKTSLRKRCLQETEYVVVQCSNKWSLAELHAAILKQVGFEVTQSDSKTVSGRNRITAKISATFFGAGFELVPEYERATATSDTKVPLELDPVDVNDVIMALRGFNKYIVLEDFHYLSIETQKDFAVALKAFHEKSDLCFIIIGVWLEEGRLTVYNGDLTGRIIGVNADEWRREELNQVISTGEQILRIQFEPRLRDALLNECFDSVYILQEACFKCCQQFDVRHTQDGLKMIGQEADAKSLVRSVVFEQGGRYQSFISQFSAGFGDTTLQMYKWLLLPILILDVQRLEKGLRLAQIRKLLQANHPNRIGLNVGNITQALQSTASLQVSKDIKPIILDYDQTNLKLSVVDRGFLIWLGYPNRDDLLELADLPRLVEIDKATLDNYQMPLPGEFWS